MAPPRIGKTATPEKKKRTRAPSEKPPSKRKKKNPPPVKEPTPSMARELHMVVWTPRLPSPTTPPSPPNPQSPPNLSSPPSPLNPPSPTMDSPPKLAVSEPTASLTLKAAEQAASPTLVASPMADPSIITSPTMATEVCDPLGPKTLKNTDYTSICKIASKCEDYKTLNAIAGLKGKDGREVGQEPGWFANHPQFHLRG